MRGRPGRVFAWAGTRLQVQDDYKVELIASCAVKIEGVTSESYEVKQGKLTAEYRDDRDYVIRTRTYDSAKPEKAWMIQQKPLPAGRPN